MKEEKRKLKNSLIFPVILLLAIWLVKLLEWALGTRFVFLGVYPLEAYGLIGIITAPLVHGDFSHLIANSASLFFLTLMLFYFYRSLAYKVFILIWIITGLWVWVFARESYHIGASGLVYGLAAFLFFSGVIRKNPRLTALALIVIFLYGSMIWGVFPQFLPEQNISWESHLMGLVAGLVLAVYFRKQGPRRKIYSWEWDELEEDDDEDDPNAYWKKGSRDFTY
ncbi:MAG: rhomboid family intramembrane serine protease [Bacteroidales bacterium]|nr:rhomboid family intramembrane serine protease [Bacteroidales bacterium]MCF8344796.1 rhomboid family intramembrane serine protease [Bacteroidales bacterium]MCF8351778.1 rhomboid family intramembrane serine protease [Bacteroidales bacterium]MCF8375583.1 rhomboid family intramembrane serine protease [Bacteroidales bacterium]